MTIEELLKHPEYGKLITSYVDKRVTGALRTHATSHPGAPELAARVERLETNASARIQAAELRSYVVERSYATGVRVADLDTLGITFKSREDVDLKLAHYAGLRMTAETAARNEMLAGSHKPGSGTAAPGRPSLDKLTQADMNALEGAGALNALLRTR